MWTTPSMRIVRVASIMETAESSPIPVLAVTVAVGAVVLLISLICNLVSKQGSKEDSVKSEVVNDQAELSNGKQHESKKRDRVAGKGKRDAGKDTFTHPWLASSLKGHSDTILGMDLSPNDKYLASCSGDRSILLWNVKEFEKKEHKSVRANVELDHATQVKFSPDSRAFITSISTGNTVRIFKIGKKADGSMGNINADPEMDFPKKHKAEITHIGIACTGKFIMTASLDTIINIWDLKGQLLTTLDTQQVQNFYSAVSPCGRFVATSGFTPDVKVWEVVFSKTGDFTEARQAFQLTGHTSGVYSFAFNNDSTRMASVSKDGTWKLWNTNVEYKMNQDAKLMKTGQCPGPGQSRIALSPDGRTIALATDRDIYVYIGATAQEEARMLNVHDAPIRELMFNQTGNFLISAGGRHMRVFHNVVGYKATITDLRERVRTAKTDSLRQRLQEQVAETEKRLKEILGRTK